ncbi:MAG: hypothetical protein F6J93_28425 [Oscillatoria sp. SIO1A7]|nr:hypothetical protein [Oscillatoria sp. SIO1A7]
MPNAQFCQDRILETRFAQKNRGYGSGFWDFWQAHSKLVNCLRLFTNLKLFSLL